MTTFKLAIAVLLATFTLGTTANNANKVVQVDWENRWPYNLASPEPASPHRNLQAQYLNCEANCFSQFNSSGIYGSCSEHVTNTSLAYDCISRCIIRERFDADLVFDLGNNLACLPAQSCDQANPCSLQELCAMNDAVRGSPNILVDNGPGNCQVTSCNQLPTEVPVVQDNGVQCIQNCINRFPTTISGDCDAAEEYFVTQQICFENCLREFRLEVFGGGANPIPQCLSATAYTCSTEEFCVLISGTNGIDQFNVRTECAQSCTMNCIEYVEVQNSILAALGVIGGGVKRDNILDTDLIFLIHIVVTAVAFFIATN